METAAVKTEQRPWKQDTKWAAVFLRMIRPFMLMEK